MAPLPARLTVRVSSTRCLAPTSNPGRGFCLLSSATAQDIPTRKLVTWPLTHGLMKLAANDDRKLSEYVHLVLHRHVFGHLPMVRDDAETRNENKA